MCSSDLQAPPGKGQELNLRCPVLPADPSPHPRRVGGSRLLQLPLYHPALQSGVLCLALRLQAGPDSPLPPSLHAEQASLLESIAADKDGITTLTAELKTLEMIPSEAQHVGYCDVSMADENTLLKAIDDAKRIASETPAEEEEEE